MKAEGIDVVDLSIGEPDFPTPDERQGRRNQSHPGELHQVHGERRHARPSKRPSSPGSRRTYGLTYAPNEVIVSTGAKSSLFHLLQAIINAGDEVIIPAPYWVTYPHAVKLAKGKPVFVPTKEENGFTHDGRRPQGPHHPGDQGRHSQFPVEPDRRRPTRRRSSQALADVVRGEDIYVIADEIYAALVYDDFTLPELRRPGRGHQEKDDPHQRRLQVLLHDRLADRLRPRPGRHHRRHGQDPEPHDFQRRLDLPAGQPRGARRAPARRVPDGPGVPAPPQLLPDEASRPSPASPASSRRALSTSSPTSRPSTTRNSTGRPSAIPTAWPIISSGKPGWPSSRATRSAPTNTSGSPTPRRWPTWKKGWTGSPRPWPRLKPARKTKRVALSNAVTRVRKAVPVDAAVTRQDPGRPRGRDRDAISRPRTISSGTPTSTASSSSSGRTSPISTISGSRTGIRPSSRPASSPTASSYAVDGIPGREPRAFYNSETKTGVFVNCDNYGPLRSLALGLVDGRRRAALRRPPGPGHVGRRGRTRA